MCDSAFTSARDVREESPTVRSVSLIEPTWPESNLDAGKIKRNPCTAPSWPQRRAKWPPFREDRLIPRLSTQLNSTTLVSVQLKIPICPVPPRRHQERTRRSTPRPLQHDAALEFEGHSGHTRAYLCFDVVQ